MYPPGARSAAPPSGPVELDVRHGARPTATVRPVRVCAHHVGSGLVVETEGTVERENVREGNKHRQQRVRIYHDRTQSAEARVGPGGILLFC